MTEIENVSRYSTYWMDGEAPINGPIRNLKDLVDAINNAMAYSKDVSREIGRMRETRYYNEEA